MASAETISCTPESQAERDAISAQLERLLSHPSFKGSRRCQALLRYIVENQLQGATCKLKERMIGIAVFGRPPDYDSNSDPVVRTTATDLRKRLAQYYHEPGHENELRLALPAGSYRIEFHSATQIAARTASINLDVPAHIDSPAPLTSMAGVRRTARTWKPYLLSACLLVALIASLALKQPNRPARTLNDFWSPIKKSGPALLCVGTWNVSSITSEIPPSSSTTLNIRDLLPMTDAVAFSRVAAFFGQANLPFRVESAKTTTLTDLTQGPAVFIGAIDNQWTLRVTDQLRFHFVPPDGQGKWHIADRKNAGRKFIAGEGDVPGSTEDYAIIGRLSDGTSGQMSVLVAGMGAAGTTAASEFVTSGEYMNALARQVPSGFKTKNLEALISVLVVDSKPGAPHIESVEMW